MNKRLAKEKHNAPFALSELQQLPEKRLGWTFVVPYGATTATVQVSYESGYPFTAPYVQFLPPIDHPNIHPSGQVSNLIVDPHTWSPTHTITTIYNRVVEILANPDTSYILNPNAISTS